MNGTLQKLWQYNGWANEILFDAFEQHAKHVSPFSMKLLSHIVNTQVVWLERLTGRSSSLTAWDVHDLPTCVLLHKSSTQSLQELLVSFDNPDRMVYYTNFKGVSFSNTVHDILIQIFNHATYHRAQIARDFREHGIEPVSTDYITFVRT